LPRGARPAEATARHSHTEPQSTQRAAFWGPPPRPATARRSHMSTTSVQAGGGRRPGLPDPAPWAGGTHGWKRWVISSVANHQLPSWAQPILNRPPEAQAWFFVPFVDQKAVRVVREAVYLVRSTLVVRTVSSALISHT
jgi:hypothetical protein